MDAGLRASWDAVREGLADGAAATDVPAVVAATLPELLQDDSAAASLARGIPAVAGLRTALACAAALRRPEADPLRLHAIAAAAMNTSGTQAPLGAGADPGERAAGMWLGEAEAKALARARGIAVPDGRVVEGEHDAVRVAHELGGPVAIKASSPAVLHKSEAGALALGVAGDDAVRSAHRCVVAAAGPDATVLVEAMVPPSVELLVAVHRDAVVPAVVVGLGGVWTELLDDVAIVPLPAEAARVEAALRSLRGAAMLTGARGAAPVDLAALAALACAAGDLLIAEGLSLLELNPVIAGPGGAAAVDALARR